MRLLVIGGANVANVVAGHGARLVLVSSDVVFSGADGLYAESAPPDPITSYGAAKAAETVALAVCPDVVIARTSPILGDGTSQHERLVHALVPGTEGALFDDEQRCPVHVADLAAAGVAGPIGVRLDGTLASRVLSTRLRGVGEFL